MGVQGKLGVQGAGGLPGSTGPQGISGQFPPFPNDDLVSMRPNQPVSVNVVTAVSTNPGFGPSSPGPAPPTGFTGVSGMPDTPGSDITSLLNIHPIVTVTTVKTTANGTLTQAGFTYSYTPNPRFVGIDHFSYNVTDSSGITSKTSAMGIFNIVSVPPSGLGPRFLYATTTTPGSVYQYTGTAPPNTFTETLLFTSTLGSTTINCLATNRDDSLIYWCDSTGGTPANIYAYDYIAGHQFTLITASNANGFQNNYSSPNPLPFSGPGVNPNTSINFNNGGAGYNNYILYLAGNGLTLGYYRIAVAPYVAGSFAQTVLSVSYIQWSDGLGRTMGDISYDTKNSNLIVTYLDTNGKYNVCLVHPSNGNVLLPPATLSTTVIYQNAIGPDNVCYAIGVGQTTINTLNISNYTGTSGTGSFDIPTTYSTTRTVNDMADWLSQPVAL